jgi:O-antigen ligase
MIFFYLLILVLPMPNHPLFSVTVAGFSLLKLLGLICLIYSLFHLGPAARNVFRTFQAKAALLLVLIGFVSTQSVVGSFLGSAPMQIWVFCLGLLIIAQVLITKVKHLRMTLLMMIASVIYASLYVLREWQLGGFSGRPGWVTGDSNYFAATSLLVLPVALALLLSKQSRMIRLAMFVSLAIIMLAFAAAGSRGALLGLATSFIWLFWRAPKLRKKLLVVGLLGAIALAVLPISPVKRLLHPDYSDELGTQIRKTFWATGVEMIQDHPIAGIGLGRFANEVQDRLVAQGNGLSMKGMACNTFIEMSSELGIVGGLLVFAMFAGSLKSVRAFQRTFSEDVFLSAASLGFEASLVGYFIASIFLSLQYEKPFWLSVALTGAMTSIVRHHNLSLATAVSETKIDQPEFAITEP